MPTYTLRRFLRPGDGSDGVVDETRELEASTDAEAVQIAQASVAEPEQAIVGLELVNASERVIWSLRRGSTISERPNGM